MKQVSQPIRRRDCVLHRLNLWTTVWTTTFSKDPQKAQKRPFAHRRIWCGTSKDFEGVVVPRDRIELSTPAFSGLCSAN